MAFGDELVFGVNPKGAYWHRQSYFHLAYQVPPVPKAHCNHLPKTASGLIHADLVLGLITQK